MAAAKQLDADYQEAWEEYEHAMLRENAVASERDAAKIDPNQLYSGPNRPASNFYERIGIQTHLSWSGFLFKALFK